MCCVLVLTIMRPGTPSSPWPQAHLNKVQSHASCVNFSHNYVPVPTSPTMDAPMLCNQSCSESSAPLSEILNALEKEHPGSNFTEMLIPLQEAGVHTVDEALHCGETMLVEWTGLPSHQVATLCDHFERLSIGKPLAADGDSITSNSSCSSSESDTEEED